MTKPLSLGASIVLYKTRIAEIEGLVTDLFTQGVSRLYLIDNSPLAFDTFGDWVPPDRVVIVRVGSNLGYGRAHNIAIADSMVRHRYHLVSNPDIELDRNVLPRLYAEMESRPGTGLVMPEVVGMDGNRHYLCKRSPSPLNYLPWWLAPRGLRRRWRAHMEMRDCSYEDEMRPECLSGCFMFLRSAVLKKTGLFDDRFFMYFEDFDLSRRVLQVSDTLYYPHARIVHEHRRGHVRSARLLVAFGLSAFKYFNKWGWIKPSRRTN